MNVDMLRKQLQMQLSVAIIISVRFAQYFQ